MTEFSSLYSARATLAILDRDIAQAEIETRERVERLRADGFGYNSEQIKRAWDACALRTRPLRKAREELVKAMTTVIAAQPIPAVIVDR